MKNNLESTIKFRTSPTMRERVERVAGGRRISEFMRNAVEEYLNSVEIKKAAKLSEGSGSLFGKSSR